jgi:hypothetical protein
LRSKIAREILDKTPQEIRDEVRRYGDRIVRKEKIINILLIIGVSIGVLAILASIWLAIHVNNIT